MTETDPGASSSADHVSVQVGITLAETVTYYLPVTVLVPPSVAADQNAVRQHVADDWEPWLEQLDINRHFQFVDDRELLDITVLGHPADTDDQQTGGVRQ